MPSPSPCSPRVYRCPYCRRRTSDIVVFANHLDAAHPGPAVLKPPKPRGSRNGLYQLLARTINKVRPRKQTPGNDPPR